MPGLQAGNGSFAIEKTITAHDELFKDDVFPKYSAHPAAKEGVRYWQAPRIGFGQVRQNGSITAIHIATQFYSWRKSPIYLPGMGFTACWRENESRQSVVIHRQETMRFSINRLFKWTMEE